jgi:hypothetical protein
MINERIAALHEAMRNAAATDGDIAWLYATIKQQRHIGARVVAEAPAALGPLRDDLDLDTATDVLWLLKDPALYPALVGDRGWRIATSWSQIVPYVQLSSPAAARSRKGLTGRVAESASASGRRALAGSLQVPGSAVPRSALHAGSGLMMMRGTRPRAAVPRRPGVRAPCAI